MSLKVVKIETVDGFLTGLTLYITELVYYEYEVSSLSYGAVSPPIHGYGSKMAVKLSSLVKKLMYILKLF